MIGTGLAARLRTPDSRILALSLSAVTALVYARAAGAGFFSDDYTWLARLPATLAWPPFVFTVFYRDFNPVLHLSFAIDWWAGGGGAIAFHITSIAIHALSAGLLLLVCRQVGCGPWSSLMAASLWALNSRLHEPVIWAAARGHSLATLFTLGALLALTRPLRPRPGLAASLFLVALLSKETAIVPLLLSPLFLARAQITRWRLLPLALPACAFILFHFLGKPASVYSSIPFDQLLLKTPFILLRPLGLGDRYDFTWIHFGLFVLAAGGGSIWLLRRTIGLKGVVWLAACSLPVIPLDKLSSRYVYLMAIGYSFCFAGLVESVRPKIEARSLRIAFPAGLAAAVLLILISNGILLQREIDDYTLMARPYEECAGVLSEPAQSLRPPTVLAVADTSPRRAVAEIVRAIHERGTSAKLIPFRGQALGGLVELRDAVNVARAGAGGLYAVLATPGRSDAEWWCYQGDRIVRGPPPPGLNADRVYAVRLGTLSEYLDEEYRLRLRGLPTTAGASTRAN